MEQVQSAHAVVKAPKSCHITPVLCSLHWLRITERIKYKLLSLTKSSQPLNLLHICTTSSLFNLTLHLLSPSLDHQHHPRCILLIAPFGVLHLVSGINFLVLHSSPSVSDLPAHAPTISSHPVNSPLSPSITPSLFHSRLKTYLFDKSFPP